MRILPKTLSVIGLTSVLALATLGATGSHFILGSARTTEWSEVTEHLSQATSQWNAVATAHARMTSDYGVWPDAHDFVAHGNNDFIARNLNADPFKNLGLNFLAYYRGDGAALWQRAFDLDNHEFQPWPTDLEAQVHALPGLIHGPRDTDARTGLTVLNDRLALISLQPVMRTHDEFPVAGSVLFGRYLTNEDSRSISALLGEDVSIERSSDTCDRADGCVVVSRLDQEFIQATRLLADIRGKPVARLTVRIPRAHWSLALTNLQRFILIAIGLVVVIGLAIYRLLSRAVIKPLTNLVRRVRGIGADKVLEASSTEDDCDELIELETALRATLKKLHDAEASLLDEQRASANSQRMAVMGEFARSLVHEINNPAMVALERARMVRSSLASTDPQAKQGNNAELVVRSIERMVAVTGALRIFGTGVARETLEVASLDAIASRVETQFADWFRSLAIEWRYQPQASSPSIHCVPYLVEYAIGALVKNALEAFEATQTKGHITLRVESPDAPRVHRVTVENNGPPISSDALSNLFDPFYSTKSDTPGIGLGLAIVEKIALHHDGKVSVESCATATRFTLEIPRLTDSTSVETAHHHLASDDLLGKLLAPTETNP